MNNDDRLLCPNPKCNGELEFIDRWDYKHDKGCCVKCGVFYHLLEENEYYRLTDVWNKQYDYQREIATLKDKLHRRNMQIKDLKTKGIYRGLELAQKIIQQTISREDAYLLIGQHKQNLNR